MRISLAARNTRIIVIDTDIIQAAGNPGKENPRSKACRKFLRSILKICHCTIVSAALWNEWKRHKSHYSHTWLTEMFGQKKVNRVELTEYKELRRKLRKHCTDRFVMAIIEKDICLCELAFRSDKIIASMDDSVRNHLGNLAERIVELQQIVWVNPENQDENVIAWLAEGAPAENERKLGQYSKIA
jgi:hypothetical protein